MEKKIGDRTMPEKWDPVSGPTHKLLSLFCLLLFTGRTFSLAQLAKQLECSKQTVLRLIDALEAQSWAQIESFKKDKQRWFRMEAPERKPTISFSSDELMQLALCRDLVIHLLPSKFREKLGNSVFKTGLFLKDVSLREEVLAPIGVTQSKGSVDYSPFEEMIETLLRAIKDERICIVTYHALDKPEARTYPFAPMRLLSFNDSLYVLGYILDAEDYCKIKHDNCLAIHRLQKVCPTGHVKEFQPIKDFEKRHFGFMPGHPFPVRVRFDERVARYVAERQWSSDQKVSHLDDGRIELFFTATSQQEVVAWLLSFGCNAEALEPNSLRDEIAEQAILISKRYHKNCQQ
jgi:predicted DNA-binding transcriptional regulator YafY